ncbi:MAG: DeoR family transcriptional regulator [Candidatus Berkelbacteria bacterium]
MNIFISIVGGVVGGLIIGYMIWGRKDHDLISEKEVEKAANLEKVRGLISTQEKITNEEVQNLLKVSDATAERYLDELESSGLICQVGKTGTSTYYEKN